MRMIASFILILLLPLSSFAADPARMFPFTQVENQDGSKYVWFLYDKTGHKYDYVPAKDLPKSAHFEEVTVPQAGDVAWWPGFMAIVNVNGGKPVAYLTAENERSVDDLESLYGKPRFYRYLVLDHTP